MCKATSGSLTLVANLLPALQVAVLWAAPWLSVSLAADPIFEDVARQNSDQGIRFLRVDMDHMPVGPPCPLISSIRCLCSVAFTKNLYAACAGACPGVRGSCTALHNALQRGPCGGACGGTGQYAESARTTPTTPSSTAHNAK